MWLSDNHRKAKGHKKDSKEIKSIDLTINTFFIGGSRWRLFLSANRQIQQNRIQVFSFWLVVTNWSKIHPKNTIFVKKITYQKVLTSELWSDIMSTSKERKEQEMVITLIILSIIILAYKEAGDRSKEVRTQMLKSLNWGSFFIGRQARGRFICAPADLSFPCNLHNFGIDILLKMHKGFFLKRGWQNGTHLL